MTSGFRPAHSTGLRRDRRGGPTLRSSIAAIGSAILLLSVMNAFAHPGSGIVVSSQGVVYFTDTGRGVWKIDAQGNLSFLPASRFHWMALDESARFGRSPKSFGGWFERVPLEDGGPVLVICSDFPFTFNRDGNLYYADTRPAAPRIVRRTPEGAESVLAAGAMFQDISGIAAGADGSLYITDANLPDTSALLKIAPDGTLTTITRNLAEMRGTAEPPPETPFGYCRGVVVDSAGVAYIAATGSRAVLRVSPQGAVSSILKTESPWSPTGMAVHHGEVYVLEWREPPAAQSEDRPAWVPRVRKIGRDGKVTTLATVAR